VRFWEDTWFGTSPLVVQFWDLYSICDQVGSTVAEIWDGQEVKLTFRRTFSSRMMERWLELQEVVSSRAYNSDGDALIWTYESKGEYSTKSLCSVTLEGCNQSMFLQYGNQIMTVDNLLKRGISKPLDYQLCKENESVHHLLFDCVIARYIWDLAYTFPGLRTDGFLCMASRWYMKTNMK
jgi:hypothetical protein